MTGSRADSLTLIGSALAFDFTNTSSGRGSGAHQEHLRKAADVIAWACHARVLPPAGGDLLAARVAVEPELAGDMLDRALALREALYVIGAAYSARQTLEPWAIAVLSAVHARCIAQARLVPNGAAYVWSWDPVDAPVAAILGPIVLSALAMIIQADVARIRQCGGQNCGWLFFDTTKNGSRRWCEMHVCGNRAKMRRRRARAPAGLGVGGIP